VVESIQQDRINPINDGGHYSPRLLAESNNMLCRKNVTILFHYNSDKHESILTIFGKAVAPKVGNEKIIYFPTCFCTTWRNIEKHKK